MTVTLRFPAPAQVITQNQRLHYMAKARLTKAWREAGYVAAWKQGCPQAPSFVRVTFPVKTNRRRDSDGPAPTCKAIVDGLTEAGFWPDDTPDWVECLGSRFDKTATEVVVELIPFTEGIT